MKSRQFCSVCKEWLDMEVVPTNDGDDDGVVWFRCPQCQGFLPKLKGPIEETESTDPPGEETPLTEEDAMQWDSPAAMMKELEDTSNIPDVGKKDPAPSQAVPDSLPDSFSDDDVLVGMVPDSSVEPMAEPMVEPEIENGQLPAEQDSDDSRAEDQDSKGEPSGEAEPILEYAAMLAELDASEAAPYRPWETYEVGQCVNHLAWNDCGVVVAKENLPGGRQVIKCYFEDAGVVRLIEKAPR